MFAEEEGADFGADDLDVTELDDDEDVLMGVSELGAPVKEWTMQLAAQGPATRVALYPDGRLVAGGMTIRSDNPLFARLMAAGNALAAGPATSAPTAAVVAQEDEAVDLPMDDSDLLDEDVLGADDGYDDDDDLLLGVDEGDDLLGADLGDDDGDLLGDDDLGEDDNDLLGAEQEEQDDLGEDDNDLLGDVCGDDACASAVLGGSFEDFISQADAEIEDLSAGSFNQQPAALDPGAAKALNHRRTQLARGYHVTAEPAKKQKVAAAVARTDAKLKSGSANKGVDYTRLRPKTPGTPGEPVMVIAIRKRAGEVEARKEAVGQYGAAVGYYPDNPVLLDVLGADLYRTEMSMGPAEGVAALDQYTETVDWLQGSTAAFPDGEGAPFPPPRRVGAEVY